MKWFALALVALAACSDDAPGPDFTFTGAYEDWDSDDGAGFLGVNGATVVEVAHPDNTATTAPNGRFTLTLPGQEGQVTYTADGYLVGRYTVEPSAAVDPVEVRGITEARIATFYETDLGVGAWDPESALVEIETRSAGVTVTVGGVAGHPFLDAYVVFPNVDVGDGTVSLEVDGGGLTCHAPSALHVGAGEVAMTTVVCE